MIVALMLGVFVLIASIVIVRKNKNDRKKEIEFFLWFFLIVAIFMLFFRLGSEEIRISKRKIVNICIIDNKPCFYIDNFDGARNFLIYNINTYKDTLSNKPLEITWSTDKIFLESKKRILASNIVGKNNCILYGLYSDNSNILTKNLEVGTIYGIRINAHDINVPHQKLDYKNKIIFESTFYLSKNPKTGKFEANILNNEQRITWLTKEDNRTKTK
jgi:hypothetical protein